ncbi:DNA methyltransferase [Phenylobacterium sp.]|jgi:DNA modification methylase|uniref:site-specific DNA-methyltransferase n=1 Tax=Phenylobacterium sp. TaxID=1871053 RepID=UPI002E2FAC8D|nr:DNA methyltransferase [Phenylobacterium sp.]HEX3365789.1 DNA methyltransferase [Phenylobacterium sp.]
MQRAQRFDVEQRQPAALRPYAGNARSHSKAQIRQIADSIQRFGFTNPVLITDDGQIIAGHGRVEAAKLLQLPTVPTIKLSHLNEAERRAYVIADNKLALNAGWDQEILAIELQALTELDFDISITGFSAGEIDLTLDAAREANAKPINDAPDEVPRMQSEPVSQPGDIWVLGRHRLICGDARDEAVVLSLMGNEIADLIFTDPPYNVAIDGNVTGLGRVRHREFAMAAGEMSEAAFVEFLTTTLGNAAAAARDGAIAFVCMDWRHMGELQDAGRQIFTELKNVCVWNKSNAGMGTFYRSKHELIFAFKVGAAPHINTFGLGASGRYRTNVWDYPGVSSGGTARAEALAMHPTVKPTALVADAIRDCSRRGGIVLDVFGGSGTTLIAAEICGRSGRLIEYDPLYCDTIVRRWQRLTGKVAVLEESSASSEDVETLRLGEIA